MTQASPPAAPSAGQSTTEFRDAFVAHIQAVCAEPGKRAALRSGLRRPVEAAPRMHAIVARWAQKGPSEWAYYAVAAMIAAQPRGARDHENKDETVARTESGAEQAANEPRKGPSLGVTLANAVKTPSAKFKEDRAEALLHLLTRQSVTGLHQQLPALVQRLRAQNVAVNWRALLDDMIAWPYGRDRIAKRWLQDFYRTLHTPSDKSATGEKDEN